MFVTRKSPLSMYFYATRTWGGEMFEERNTKLECFPVDGDQQAIRVLLGNLRGHEHDLSPKVDANLVECAEMALFHGKRMKFQTQDAFDALAAVCLVVGERRAEFFENVFLNRMIENPNLTARDKLNRIIEIVVGTIPRPAPRVSNDNPVRESA